MGNACGCDKDSNPIDPTLKEKEEEEKRQKELSEALAGMDVEPFDLEKELVNGQLDEIQEDEEQSIDSDIIPEDKIPPKPAIVMSAVKGILFQKIMKQQQRVIQKGNSETIKIYPEQVKNLSSTQEE